MDNPQIFILILNWNGKEDTLNCLDSVQKINYPNYKVVVIDNGSIDNSVSAIREKFPHIFIIETKKNLGFAGGNNIGIEYAMSQGADYIFLLNNDTIVDPQVLSALIAASQKHPEAGILGSKIYYYNNPNKIWYAGANWIPEHVRFEHIGYQQIDNGQNWEEIKETDYICGCALLIKTEVIKKIGLLDSRYFLMWEETDWCYQARRFGYKSLFVPSSKLWHKISASFSGGDEAPHYQYFWWRNRLLWIEKNISFPEQLALYKVVAQEFLQQLKRYLDPSKTVKEKTTAKAAIAGVRDYFSRRFGNCPAWVLQQPNKT